MADSPKTWLDWQLSLMEAALAACRDDAERARHLDGWFARWQGRYDRFSVTEGDSERGDPTYGRPYATDFVNIIAEISKRRAQLEQVPA